jgi:hypothetical protein
MKQRDDGPTPTELGWKLAWWHTDQLYPVAMMLLCLSSRLKVGRCGDFPQPALVALGETGVVGVAELET